MSVDYLQEKNGHISPHTDVAKVLYGDRAERSVIIELRKQPWKKVEYKEGWWQRSVSLFGIDWTATLIACADCNQQEVTKDMYGVVHEIWLSVATKDTTLCLPCFEKRIGRQLNSSELKGPNISYIMESRGL